MCEQERKSRWKRLIGGGGRHKPTQKQGGQKRLWAERVIVIRP